jgi:hypothetical protein
VTTVAPAGIIRSRPGPRLTRGAWIRVVPDADIAYRTGYAIVGLGRALLSGPSAATARSPGGPDS